MSLFVDLIKTNQFRCVLAVSLCSTIMGFTNSFTGTAIVSMRESEIYMDNEDVSRVELILKIEVHLSCQRSRGLSVSCLLEEHWAVFSEDPS